MNAMLILEAVGYLDEDLLERSERPRSTNRRWVPWVAMAACICVIFVGARGFLLPKKAADSAMNGELDSPQSPADDKLVQDSVIDSSDFEYESFFEKNSISTGNSFGAWYIVTDGMDTLSYPQSFVINDRQALEEYHASNWTYLEGSNFEEVMSKYYDDYFETHQLLALVLRENNASVTHRLTDAYWDEETAQWQVSLQRMIPLEKAQAAGPSYWHILIEVDAVETGENEKVRLRQTTYRETTRNEWTFVSVDE